MCSNKSFKSAVQTIKLATQKVSCTKKAFGQLQTPTSQPIYGLPPYAGPTSLRLSSFIAIKLKRNENPIWPITVILSRVNFRENPEIVDRKSASSFKSVKIYICSYILIVITD